MDNYDEFYDFMEQYIDFYNDVCNNEKNKMDALESDNLKLINEVLSDYQVFVTRAELYEKRRKELFKKIGLDGKTILSQKQHGSLKRISRTRKRQFFFLKKVKLP